MPMEETTTLLAGLGAAMALCRLVLQLVLRGVDELDHLVSPGTGRLGGRDARGAARRRWLGEMRHRPGATLRRPPVRGPAEPEGERAPSGTSSQGPGPRPDLRVGLRPIPGRRALAGELRVCA